MADESVWLPTSSPWNLTSTICCSINPPSLRYNFPSNVCRPWHVYDASLARRSLYGLLRRTARGLMADDNFGGVQEGPIEAEV